MNIRIAIVEDEPIWLDQLAASINRWAKDQHSIELHSFHSGEEIVAHFKAKTPEYDIVFADIVLDTIAPGIDGMETAKVLKDLGYSKPIVLTTNQRDFEYAKQSVNIGIARYINKPVSESDIDSCMELIMQEQCFTYTSNNAQYSIPFKSILYFESKKHYIEINSLEPAYHGNKFRCKISEFTELYRLPKSFVQCQRSYIVNIMHVVMLKDNKLYMRNDEKKAHGISISEQYVDQVLEAYLRK